MLREASVVRLSGAVSRRLPCIVTHQRRALGYGWRPSNSPQAPTAALKPTIEPAPAAVANPGYATTLAQPFIPLASVSASACAGAGAGAGAAAAASVFGLSASWLFGATSAFMVPVYALMALFTSSKLTRTALLNSSVLYGTLAALYGITLAAAWQQAGLGAALSGAAAAAVAAARAAAEGAGGLAAAVASLASLDLSPVAAMLSAPLVTLLTWLHLLTLDALMAREIALDGLRTGVATGHSVLLCFFFGPTGLLSHALTRLLSRRPQS